MDTLYEQFIKERKYFRNLVEKTLIFYQESYSAFAKADAFKIA